MLPKDPVTSIEANIPALSDTEKTIYIAFLLLTLAFELSENLVLGRIAKVLKVTLVVAYLIMPNGENGSNQLFHYCCFGLLWVLVVAVIFSLAFLIADRERDHVDDEWKTTTTSTTVRPTS